jgi:hypothetical protein
VVQLSNPAVEAALRAHIQAIGELLILERGPHVATVEDDSYDRWARGSDGVFRLTRIRVPVLFSEWGFYQDRTHGLPTFASLVEAIAADPVLSRLIPGVVSAASTTQPLNVDRLVGEMKSTLIDTARGRLEFSEARFQLQWKAISRDLYSDSLNSVTVVLLPGLTVPGELPIEIAAGLEIAALSDAEMTRAVACGLLSAVHMPFTRDIEARAIRHIRRVPKRADVASDLASDLSIAEGDFGERPLLEFHLFTDDVLCALRLVKAASLTSPGAIRYVDSWLVDGSTQFHARPRRPSFGPGVLRLDPGDIAELKSIWASLNGSPLRTKRFIAASLRRFNMAADRYSFEDSIVDLSIAAESLFLDDQQDQELAFRVALRAAHFSDWPEYSRRDTFALVRELYGMRSKIVHGKTLGKPPALPLQPGASFDEFRKVVEEMMRRAIRKALREATTASDFGGREYWLRLVLPP